MYCINDYLDYIFSIINFWCFKVTKCIDCKHYHPMNGVYEGREYCNKGYNIRASKKNNNCPGFYDKSYTKNAVFPAKLTFDDYYPEDATYETPPSVEFIKNYDFENMKPGKDSNRKKKYTEVTYRRMIRLAGPKGLKTPLQLATALKMSLIAGLSAMSNEQFLELCEVEEVEKNEER